MLSAKSTMAATDTPGPFGALLRRYRAAAGLSQEELAERAGLSRRGISDLERGQRRSPHPATVHRLAAGLNLDASQKATLLAGAQCVSASATGAHAQGSLAGPQT